MGSLRRAGEFVADVGFALLFPREGIALPSLWDATSDRPFREAWEDWGDDGWRVWGFKDELPVEGLAWYGHFLRGRPSFLAPDLLADLYARAGRPDDYRDEPLDEDAHRIAEVILASGPTSRAVLRDAVGLWGKAGNTRLNRAVDRLGRRLVVTHHGTSDEGGAWPSTVLELTARAFRVSSKRTPREKRARAAGRFLRTMAGARATDLARAFGWETAEARVALDGLVQTGDAAREGPVYLDTSA